MKDYRKHDRETTIKITTTAATTTTTAATTKASSLPQNKSEISRRIKSGRRL